MRDQSLSLEVQLLRLAPRVRRFALVLAQSSSDVAEALVEATFESAWRAGPRLVRQQPRLDFWLLAEAAAIWRREFQQPSRAHSASAMGLAQSAASPKQVISALPAEERLIIGLMVIERMSADQAAGILHIPPQRAAQIHARARRNLDLALGAGRREGAA